MRNRVGTLWRQPSLLNGTENLMTKVSVSTPFAPFIFLLLFFALPAFALEEGATAPDFEIPNLEGKNVRLSDFRGRIIVLKLATTWCPTCKQQVQEIREAESFLKENNVAVVEVFLQDSAEMIREHVKTSGLTLPHAVLLDNGRAAKAYNVFLIPRLLVIDKNFKIQRDGSLMTARDLTHRIKKMLGIS